MKNDEVVNAFHDFYYKSGVWEQTKWMGHTIYKCPFDMWIYQEIFFEIKPDLIIETGTWQGGSALYMAQLLDLMNSNGKIITIDIEDFPNRPQHDRITYYKGSSVAEETIEMVANEAKKSKTVLVILDSDHSKDHVLKELELYNQFVSDNSYLIVEDSNVNGHPTYPEFGPGPMESIDAFLESNKNFKVDESREKFFITFNPRGYLKKIA
ncbi:class I SAM-dependent methyltransferase [Candidatus Dojkabacteria bacterium]|uniref:Class I SAM-dependent methyltransferase n=1 Tax=Candidatus Dojkabacteria bacterium TaxID=2099670 RepID=A0A955ICR7_9BACT|nr:class I SAM-dependent methyltransferase [Candidatus Dojkabacteria bacterium]